MYRHGSHPAGVSDRRWQDGDIAFLKNCEHFLKKDHRDLIASGYVHRRATNHPVIILQAGPSHAIVTTVTAFRSGPETNFCPPWRMPAHQDKHLDDFHAFTGTALPPNSTHAHLQLGNPGAKMNKPQASWVYIGYFFTVPYTVLIQWNKVSQQLRVSEESLAQLTADMEHKYSVQLRDARSRLTACPRAAVSTPRYSTSQARHIPQHPRARRSCPTPYQPQQHGVSKPGALDPTTRRRPQHLINGKAAAHHNITKTSWHRAVSTTGAFIRPEIMQSWRQPTAA